MAHDGLEIERKYLLASGPPAALLARLGARPILIEQVYLQTTETAPVRRVRRSVSGGRAVHRYAEKRALGGIVREERETVIDSAEYRRLLKEADPARRPIRKTRHVFDFAGHTLELDVFEGALAGLALLEIELEDEDETAEIPPELGPVEDVSEDPRYLNWNLALR